MANLPNISSPADVAPTSGRFDPSAKDNSGFAADQGFMPMPSDTNTKDPFWQTAIVNEQNWNKAFPFQFLLLEKAAGGSYTIVGGQTFTLPIPPQSLTISTPFAITGSVTLGGYVEEHNGAPIRDITLQGTTGILPARSSPKQVGALTGSGTIGGIFGGTIAGAARTVAAAQTSIGGPSAGFKPNLIGDSDLGVSGDLKSTTGYFQFMMLRSYLEQYVALKKSKSGNKYRLAFAIWKDSEFYLVTPQMFQMQRSAASPLEYNYTIQLRAWRRWLPNQNAPAASSYRPVVRDANALAGVLNRVQAARRSLQGLKAVLTGFRADVDKVLFEPVRELGLFVKDAIGVGLTAADLPVNIIRDMKEAVLQAASVSTDFKAFGGSVNSVPGRVQAQVQDLAKQLRGLAVASGIASTGADPMPPTGTSRQATTSSSLGSYSADPPNKLFDDPDANPDLFTALQVGALNIKPAVAKKILEETRRVKSLTRVDFEAKRDAIVKLAADYADSIGAGNTTFARTYNRAVSTSTRIPTDDDWDLLFQLNNIALEFNRMAASTATDDKSKLTAMEYIAGQASRSGIPFKVPASAFTVPFPYGSTLEVLAKRYLGTVDRWHEIATLNDLRAPWVDEEGFTRELSVNGAGNDIQVSDIADLVVGQPIWIVSTTIVREKRRIVGLRTLSPSVHIVSLDGDGDLSRFTTANAAEIFTFLPGTVNSLQLIYIPSDKPPPTDDLEPRPNPNIDEFTQLLKVGGVDLLLTESGGLAITKDGDCRLAQGLANIIQRVRLAIDTTQGGNPRHPEFGFGIRAGSSTADVTAQGVLRAARATFNGDPTFTGIISASVFKDGPAMAIGMNIGIAGYSQLVPVTFRVRR